MDESKLQFIDAHHHLWDLQAVHYPWLMAAGERRFFGDPTPIQKNYLPGDFLAESGRFTPARSVHIQVGCADGEALEETRWLHRQPGFPHGVVAFCDLSAPDADARLDEQMAYPRVRGVRQIVGRHIEEDRRHGSDALLTNPQWARGLASLSARGLSFDLQLIPQQVDAVVKVLRQVPELPVAVCHCGSPWDQSPDGLKAWRAGLARLAELPAVCCKVSGLGMFNPRWTVDSLRPIVRDVIEVFGADRVMFGSNFPVDKLYRSYDALWSAYAEITGEYSADERQRLFVANAAAFYRLPE